MLDSALRGFRDSLKRAGFFIILLAGIGLLGAVLAIPFWYFSSRYKKGYTVFVLVLVGAVLLFLLIRRVVHMSTAAGGFRPYVRNTILPILKKTALLLCSLAALYGVALLFSQGRYIISILAAAGWLLLLGFMKYGRRNKT